MKQLFRKIAGAACAFVTLLGGIPFTPVQQEFALQAEAADTILDNILISGVPHPYTGTHPVTTGITTDEPDKITVTQVDWCEEGVSGIMSSSDVFEEGKDYYVRVFLEPKEGYAFPKSNLNNTMNIWFGRRSDESYASNISRVAYHDSWICAERSFTAYEKPDEIVKNVLITDVPRPYAGMHPVTTGFNVDEPDKVTISSARWTNNETGKVMSADDVFENGKEYYVTVFLEPKDGYAFPRSNLDSMSIWFGRRSDESYAEKIMTVANSDTKISARNYYTCMKLDGADVDNLLITGLPYPYTGTSPVTTGVTTDEPDKVNILAVEWFEEGSTEKLSANYVFRDGKTYYSRITLEPKEGYFFPMSDLDSMSIWFGRRSDESYADDIVKVGQSDMQIYVYNSYTAYTKPDEMIRSLLITGVQRPYDGEHPVMTGAVTDEPDQCAFKNLRWKDEESGEWMTERDVFEKGKEYSAYVFVEPKEGYAFPLSNLDSMDIWFDRRSDESYAEKITKVADQEGWICAINSYTCISKPVVTIDDVLILGLTHPYTGTHPTLTGITTDEPDKVKIVDVEWYDYETGQPLADTYTFRDDEKYGVRVILEPKAGYQFPSRFSSMSIYFNRRSDESYADEILSVTGSDTQICAVNSYIPYKKKNNAVEKIVIGNVRKPVAGQHPVFSGFTCENSAEVEIVSFDCWERGVSTFLTEDDVFKAGSEYCFRFWFKAKSGYVLPDTPSDMLALIQDGSGWVPAAEPVNRSAHEGEYCCRIYFKAADCMLGDVDGNNSVTASDAQMALSAFAEQLAGNDSGLTDTQFTAADVDANGEISAMDAQNILMYFLLNNVLDDPTDWSELIR